MAQPGAGNDDVTKRSPLSYGQQRLWFLHRLVPDNAFYNMSAATRLVGPVDSAAWRRAVRELVTRHDVLRCRIDEHDGMAFQVPGPADVELELMDGTGTASARELVDSWANRPFDLSRGPLIRVCLVRLSPDEHVLAVTVHHIAADLWSFNVIYTELSALYEAFAAGRTPELPDLPMRYGDFARQQRERMSGAYLAGELEFWRAQLAGAPASLELPADRPRPRIASYRGDAVALTIRFPLVAALRRLARQERSTLFVVMLAAFHVLLARWSGQQDMLVGVPSAGRAQRELEGMIGFFVNTLVVRLDSRSDPEFAELVRRTSATMFGIFAHQEIPFEALVEELSPERDLGRNPLVQVSFQLNNTPLEWFELPGTRAEWFGFAEHVAARFDLSVAFYETEGELSGEITYATDLFDRGTIEWLADAYVRVLRLVTEDPARRLSQLRLSDAVDLPPATHGDAGTVDELFRRQAKQTPDAIAVTYGTRDLTFAELRSAVNRLAHHLRRRGVGPEVTVGVCVERGPELIVAIMAVITAGGAYVPIDTQTTAESARLILADAKAVVTVTTSGLAERFAPGSMLVCLDRDRALIDAEPADEPVAIATADNLIQVLYTSGSTGRPKGVMIRHGHVADYVTWCLEHVPIGDGDAVPLSSSVTFAGATLGLFGSLLSGRRLVVPDRDDAFSWCAGRPRYSFVKLTPSALHYIRHRFGRCWDGWGCVILASEPIRPRDWELIADIAELTPVIHYGTTETNGSTVWWPGEDGRAVHPLPVGRPVSSTQLLVLDRWGDLAPPGVPGEVAISGPSVARGYLGQPAATADRFVPNPFGPPGSRLFRTGDLGRLDADGMLWLLGRADHQVKIRGFRADLHDIERVILTVAGVDDAAVLADHDPDGDLMLVAYVTGSGRQLSADELRATLNEILPPYMVPAHLVVLAELPRTPGGKIDRAALSALPVTIVSAGDPPSTSCERAVAAIWAEVLKVEAPRRDDNFFALGGHSLMAIQIITRILETSGVEVPLQSVFESPTLAGFAAQVEKAGYKDRTDQIA